LTVPKFILSNLKIKPPLVSVKGGFTPVLCEDPLPPGRSHLRVAGLTEHTSAAMELATLMTGVRWDVRRAQRLTHPNDGLTSVDKPVQIMVNMKMQLSKPY